jgi:hypothetical protein
VSLRRWRTGEWLAGIGAAALVVLLFLDWFEASGAPDADRAGIAVLGWPLVAWLALTVAGAALVLGTTAAGARIDRVIRATVLTVVAALIALVATAVRVVVAQPALGAGLADDAVSVAPAGYLGLLAVAAIAVGVWWAMADERTDAPESAFRPPPARPAPPADA